MGNGIQRAVMIGLHVTVVMAAGACLPPLQHVACGDQWCPQGYRCAPDTLTCFQSGCGNGRVEVGEECDDGNLDDEDGCLSTCRFNTCGDGKVNHGVEECDDGNGENGDGCDNNCTRTACGNGVVTAGERCDDGDAVDFDGCRNNCTIGQLAYIKASNTGAGDSFGFSVALSADGSTLAVGAGDEFGRAVALSADGSTLAVGASLESSVATGIGGNQADNSAFGAGAVYVFY